MSPSLTLTVSVGSASDDVIATFWNGAIVPGNSSVGASVASFATDVATGAGEGCSCGLEHPVMATSESAARTSSERSFMVRAIIVRRMAAVTLGIDQACSML